MHMGIDLGKGTNLDGLAGHTNFGSKSNQGDQFWQVSAKFSLARPRTAFGVTIKESQKFMNANGNSDAYTIALKHMHLWMDTLHEKVVNFTTLPCIDGFTLIV